MEPLDAASERLASLLTDIQGYVDTVRNEADTRLKIIDRLLIEVLGWQHEDIFAEEPSDRGFLDYKLCVGGRGRAIVEAKKDGRGLGTANKGAGRAYRLDGPVFATDSAKEGIRQAIRYCGQKNTELACVTNGSEWIVFRGSRLGDGRDTTEGVAFVFPDLEAISSHFALFYELVGRDNVERFLYRAHFQEAEGQPIRASEFRRSVRAPGSRRLLTAGGLSGDLERVMNSFFHRISGDEDPDLLVECFVVTKESEAADNKLVRISEDLVGQIRALETDSAEELARLIDQVRSSQRNEFVLIVGTKGAGKSTFVDRFFSHVLEKGLRQSCVVVKVDLKDNSGDEASLVEWLNQQLLLRLESTIFADDQPSFEDLQGMFFDEYSRRMKGTLRHLYERDKEQFKIDFGRHIEERRESRPGEYVGRLLEHVARVRRKLPCLVFDNADHFTIEFQERVFQYARSLYENHLAFVLMPITDRTSWHLSREGALRSFESVSLFLPTPSPRRILEKRVEFLESRIATEKKEPGRGYFLGRGIRLSLSDLTAFTATLQSVFLRTGKVARWVGTLANADIRQCLDLAKAVVTSPHLDVPTLLKAYVAKSSVSIRPWKIKKAIIRGRYDIFSDEDNRFVHNVFWLEDDVESSPLLGVRLLLLLRDARRPRDSDDFLSIEQLTDYFHAAQIAPASTLAFLNRLLERGLCWSYDPTITDISKVRRVEISPAGVQHLWWATRDQAYLQAMLEVTPIVDREAFEELDNLNQQPQAHVWQEKLKRFVDYLQEEDRRFVSIPDHNAYRGQTKLHADMDRIMASSVTAAEEDALAERA